jgi:diguanylate cyclase (GGDEF)-like protein
MKLLLGIFFTAIVLSMGQAQAGVVSREPRILILNSYHQGYQWSDREINGFRDTLLYTYPRAEILVEYMDTKRGFTSTLFDELYHLYAKKYRKERFDLLLAADDSAFQFLKKYRNTLFSGTPVVFCGLNGYREEMINGMADVSGVAEFYDIRNTIHLITKLQPEVKRVAVITDTTPSGQLLLSQLKMVTGEFAGRLDFEILDYPTLAKLEQRLSALPSSYAVLLLDFFCDPSGTYYNPETILTRIYKSASVPVYGCNEFAMGYGQLGGMIGEGYTQGQLAAKIGLRILAGEDADTIPVVTRWPNRLMVDYRQMVRFGLKLSDLPPEAMILNNKREGQKDILILHSYDPGFLWTSRLNDGLRKGLEQRQDVGEIAVEYMDAKRHSSPSYFHSLFELYQTKYTYKDLDLVIVTDDDAFNFVRRYRDLLFKGVPIVFCGVNYLEDKERINREGITGILESTDVLGTLNVMLKIYPKAERILLINDRSSSGRQFHRRINALVSSLGKPVPLVFTDDMGMEEVLDEVARLDDRTAVLFLTLTCDVHNNRYPITESIRLLSQASSRPLFGLRESHLKSGLAGGSISNGVEHGLEAARLAGRILDGASPERIPIIDNIPHSFVFSYPVLQRYHVPLDRLPPNSLILEAPSDFFSQHKEKIVLMAIVIFLLFFTVIVQHLRLRRKERRQQEIESEARIDGLTGAIVRKYCLPEVQALAEESLMEKKKFAICYCDINDLKFVNDNFGHHEGDSYIRAMVELIRSPIRASDRIYRVGGDEFVVLFALCDKIRVLSHIETINRELDHINSQPGAQYQMGLSFGVAEFDPTHPRTAESLLEEADREMYMNKQQGGYGESRDEGFSPRSFGL